MYWSIFSNVSSIMIFHRQSLLYFCSHDTPLLVFLVPVPLFFSCVTPAKVPYTLVVCIFHGCILCQVFSHFKFHGLLLKIFILNHSATYKGSWLIFYFKIATKECMNQKYTFLPNSFPAWNTTNTIAFPPYPILLACSSLVR